MAQHDYNIANQTGANFRADLNNALEAIATVNSGGTEPSTTFAHQLWVDTSSSELKIRNSDDNSWITTGVSITASNTFIGNLTGDVTGNLTGNVTGNVTGDLTGNADSADTLSTARTISLSGDVVGSVSFDGSSNIDIDTVVQINSITLGTDTTGDYVESISGGTGVILTGGTGEGSTPSIAIGQAVATTDNVTFNKVTASNEFIGDIDGAVRFTAKTTEDLSKGDVVYVSGVSGNTATVSKAKADDTSKMPAFGLAIEDANANNNLQIVTLGNLTNIDTSNFSEGQILYVSTTAGEYTTTIPSGESSQIQNIGKVLRSHAVNGSIRVGGAGRSNATPNLDNGKIFIGNGSNQSSTATLDTSIVVENTNLYYTQSRFDSAFTAKSTSDLSEGTNLYYTTARANTDFDTRLATKDTGNLAEGSNLYYTDARSYTAFDTRLATKDTDDLSEGTNLYYTQARFDSAFGNKTTADLTENTNLYYTDTRANSAIDARVTKAFVDALNVQAASVDANSVTLGTDTVGNYIQTITGTANKITVSGSGSESADVTLSLPDDVQIADSLTVAGNLTVNGTLTSLDTTNLDIEDNLFQLNAGLTGSPVNDSGMLINRGTADNSIFMWDESVDKFTMGLTTADGSATGNITLNSLGTLVVNVEGNLTGAVTGTVSSLSNHDTADLTEGSNLYYTQARFDSAFTAKSTSDLSEGTNLYYTDARFDTRLASKDTDDVSEGTSNLYYTSTRFDSAFGGKSTSDLSEGTNLYYTSARANTDFDTRLATKDTGDLSEGSNLYYTDARAQAVSINNVVEDTTPQLGGDLDLNSSDITGTGDINITGTITSSGNITGTLATAAQPNITSLGTLTALTGGTGDLNWDSGTLFVDSSANVVGIGETSPQAGLELASTAKGIFTSGDVYPYPTGNAYIKVKGTNAEHNWIGITGGYEQSSGSANLMLQPNFRLTNEQAGNYIGSEAQSITTADITFGKLVGGSSTSTNATKSEFMRIDSNGNLLVGTTSTNGAVSGGRIFSNGRLVTTVSGQAHYFNRLSSDGDIVSFYKNSSAVGSIGTANSGDLYIGNDDTTLLFAGGSDAILPRGTAGAARDGAISLGLSSHRFKDLYLSGTVHAVKADIDISTDARLTINDIISEVGDGNVALQAQNSAGSALKPMGFRAEDIRFATGSSERMRIDSSGNVNIGSTNSGVGGTIDLSVGSTSSTGGITLWSPTNGTHSIGFGDGYTGSDRYRGYVEYAHNGDSMRFATAATERLRIDSSGDLNIVNTGQASLNYTTDGSLDYARITGGKSGSGVGDLRFFTYSGGMAERMRIDSSGNVGIGETSPDGELHVKGTGGGNGDIYVERTSGAKIHLQAQSATGIIGTKSNHDLAFKTNDTQRMKIDTSGNLLVGTTVANPAGANSVGVAISSGSYGGFIGVTRDGNTPVEINRKTSDGTLITFRKDSSAVGSIGTDGGSLVIGGGDVGIGFYQGSDALVPINGGTRAVRDSAIDLGMSDAKYKNLYLSNTIGNGAGEEITFNNAQDYLRFDTSGSEAMRIDASGNLLVGTTSAYGSSGVTLDNDGVVYSKRSGGIGLYVDRETSDGALAEFRKDGSSVGNINVEGGELAIGRTTAGLQFLGSEARIRPFNISTNAATDNTIDLGRSNTRFNDIYATNGTIQTSDRNEKQDIEALTDAETRVAVAAKGLLRKFKWKSAVEEKGDEARTHFGIIAQDLQDAFTAEGLDAGDYAMFISDTWWEAEEVIPAVEEELDEEGNVVTEEQEEKTVINTYSSEEEAPEGAIEKTRLGVRYSELLAFIIASL